jgi:sentrin-specific protease 1
VNDDNNPGTTNNWSVTKIIEHVENNLEMNLLRDSKLVMKRKPTKKVLEKNVVKIGTVNVRLQNLMCLMDREWVNDVLIDAFTILVKEYQQNYTDLSGANYLFPTLFISQYEKFGYIRVQSYLGHIDIWQYKKMVFQRCTGGHWFTIIVKPKLKSIEIVDSLNRASKSKSIKHLPASVTPLVKMMEHDDEFKRNHLFQEKDWKLNYIMCPQQPNVYDCGVHVCIHLLVTALNITLDYEPRQMDAFRVYIYNCIVQKRLIQIQ